MKKFFWSLVGAGILLSSSSAAGQSVSQSCIDKMKVHSFYYLENNFFHIDEIAGLWNKVNFNDSIYATKSFADLNELLKGRGVKLIVVPIPARTIATKGGATYNDKSAEQIAGYSSFVESLRSFGISTIDARKILISSEGNYFDYDIHWTNLGSMNVAKETSAVINAHIKPNLNLYSILANSKKSPPIKEQLFARYLKSDCDLDVNLKPIDQYRVVDNENGSSYLTNFSGLERNSHRWAQGPESIVEYYAPNKGEGTINLSWVTGATDQRVQIVFNGKTIASNISVDAKMKDLALKVNIDKGLNTLKFSFSKWNNSGSNFAPNDVRTLAVDFFKLSISSGNSNYDIMRGLAKEDQDLLGDEGIPILLAGSSYSDEKYGFADYIKSYTGNEVLNMNIGGGGTFSSIKDTFFDKTITDNNVKVVVWEFPFFGGDEEPIGAISQVIGALYKECAQQVISNSLSVSEFTSKGYKSLKLYNKDASISSLKYSTGEKEYQKDVLLKNSNRMKNRKYFYIPLNDPASTTIRIENHEQWSIEACK